MLDLGSAVSIRLNFTTLKDEWAKRYLLSKYVLLWSHSNILSIQQITQFQFSIYDYPRSSDSISPSKCLCDSKDISYILPCLSLQQSLMSYSPVKLLSHEWYLLSFYVQRPTMSTCLLLFLMIRPISFI